MVVGLSLEQTRLIATRRGFDACGEKTKIRLSDIQREICSGAQLHLGLPLIVFCTVKSGDVYLYSTCLYTIQTVSKRLQTSTCDPGREGASCDVLVIITDEYVVVSRQRGQV